MNEAPDSFLNVAFLMNASHEYDSRAIVGDDLDGDGRFQYSRPTESQEHLGGGWLAAPVNAGRYGRNPFRSS